MHDVPRTTTTSRTLLVWTTVTAGSGALSALTTPTLVATPDPGFVGLLVRACSAAALVVGAALWLLTTEIAWSLVVGRGRVRRPRGRLLGPVRSLLLAACGVVAITTPVAAAGNDPPDPTGAQVLDGLPLPDRVGGAAPPPRPTAATPGGATVRVRVGDCLWTLAATRLGPDAHAAEVASYWPRIHALNRDVIGPDPDLIHPGQHLRLPPVEPRKEPR